ncbi:flagellar hook-associated protein FlgK [Pseudorhodobacter ferrugineus]|uniref:flagellar hook-associated protein FlgK n=1 Tax=Pseudorhodobacter ferrugineus TaxID=77008 RepID=UPI0003B6799A|nr:flagellar hook-associated protein FlgK [Pseudorhodobacter ferrugineus]
MSISGAMSSALSGLNAAARSAELISSNIANALTDGYGRRELQVTARRLGDTGHGVQVTGVSRDINQALIADRRLAGANAAGLNLQADFLSRLGAVFGSPDDTTSFDGRFAAFNTALIAASADPQSLIRQSNVVEAARGVVTSFRTISNDIQTSRSTADTQIATEVEIVNHSLVAIAELNRSITVSFATARDASALVDQRQQLIDQVAAIIPLREVQADNGRITLFSMGGATLLEGQPAKLAFSAVGIITPDMTLASGALSGLSINGRPINTTQSGAITGGSLSANFAIRDQLAPNAQVELDAVARNLINRFQDPLVDGTLSIGAAGLFTDHGAAFLNANEEGISGRMALNAAVDPNAGGAVWRVRDGLGALTQGPVGQSALLSAMQSVINTFQPTASGALAGSNQSVMSLASKVASATMNQGLLLEANAGFAAARATALQSLEMESGVDTDRELQDLLLVEQAYAANAKVIQTADDLIQILLGI